MTSLQAACRTGSPDIAASGDRLCPSTRQPRSAECLYAGIRIQDGLELRGTRCPNDGAVTSNYFRQCLHLKAGVGPVAVHHPGNRSRDRVSAPARGELGVGKARPPLSA